MNVLFSIFIEVQTVQHFLWSLIIEIIVELTCYVMSGFRIFCLKTCVCFRIVSFLFNIQLYCNNFKGRWLKKNVSTFCCLSCLSHTDLQFCEWKHKVTQIAEINYAAKIPRLHCIFMISGFVP